MATEDSGQGRSENPPFLQRNLRYKLEAKLKKKIEIIISLPAALNNVSEIQSHFPLCVVLARQESSPDENAAVYRLIRRSTLIKCTGLKLLKQDRAKFILPDMQKLSAEIKSGSPLSIMFVSCADLFKENNNNALSSANPGSSSPCLMGMIPLESFLTSLENSPNLSTGETVQMLPCVDLRSNSLKEVSFGEDKRFLFQKSESTVSSMGEELQLKVSILAKEIGEKPPGSINADPGQRPIRVPFRASQLARTTKKRKKRTVPRRGSQLHQHDFFHSQTAQPMAMEQVMSDANSEDDVDTDVANMEDRSRINEFVDVTEDEKEIMNLWNEFKGKQRVRVDGHMPWACEAFSRLHGQRLVQNPGLLMSWRLFMVKLWNHRLLDPRTMNSCNLILEEFQKQEADPSGVFADSRISEPTTILFS